MNAFRALLRTAVQFEKKAANHKRIEAERNSLAEAITQAQLVLSVADAERSELTSVKGGKAKSKVV
jgi:hypothetical protein